MARAVPAVGGHMLALGKHVLARDADIFEAQVASVNGVVTELWPDVADLDAGQGAVLLVTQLDHEDVDTLLHAVEDELRVHGRVCGGQTDVAVPPLHGLKRWCVEHKLL